MRCRVVRAVWLPLFLATALSLGGCGGTPTPAPPPTSSSPTATPSPSATEMPAAAKAKNASGAKAFVRLFLKAMVEAGESGETSAFEGLYAPTCAGCQGITDGINRVYQAGGFIRGGEWVPTKLTTYAFDGSRYPVDALVDLRAQTYKRSANSARTHAKADTAHLHLFNLKWTANGWLVSTLDATS